MGPGTVNKKSVPGLLITNWGPEPVKINRGPRSANTNWGPGPGAGAGGQDQGQGPSKGLGAGKYKYPKWPNLLILISITYFMISMRLTSVTYFIVFSDIFYYFWEDKNSKIKRLNQYSISHLSISVITGTTWLMKVLKNWRLQNILTNWSSILT